MTGTGTQTQTAGVTTIALLVLRTGELKMLSGYKWTLTLKILITSAADDILNYFASFFEKIRVDISCESDDSNDMSVSFSQ